MSSYEEEYLAWVSSLPKSKQAKLKKLGLDKPLNDQGKLNTPNNADVVFATLGTDFDYDASSSRIFDTPAKCMDDDENTEIESADDKAKAYGSLLLTWVIQRLVGCGNAESMKLDLACVAFAMGLNEVIDFKSETAIAKEFKVTKANVSYRVKEWQKIAGLKPSAFMKKQLACNSYRKTKLKNLTKKV